MMYNEITEFVIKSHCAEISGCPDALAAITGTEPLGNARK